MLKKENDTSAIGKNTYFAGLLAGFLLAIATPAQAVTVKYTELNERLPYGEPITIVGSFSDFKRGTTKVQEVMHIRSITLHYQVYGLAVESSQASITDDRWQVEVQKLPKKSQVRFTFQLIGQLTKQRAAQIIEKLIKDSKFEKKVQKFYENANGKDSEVQARHAEIFAEDLVPIVNRQLGKFELVDTDNLRGVLARRVSFVNLQPLKADLISGDQLGIEARMSLNDVYEKLKNADKGTLNAVATAFINNYENLKSALQQTIKTGIPVSINLSAFSDTKDLEKYAGIDIGTMHIPNIDELRSFCTVNIYLGAVEDVPVPLLSKLFWKRISFTVGASIKDISGGPQSEIKGNNAFIFGVGFRINKYFRLAVGRSLYRSAKASSGFSLEQSFFWGPSVDISGLPILRSLIGKNIH